MNSCLIRLLIMVFYINVRFLIMKIVSKMMNVLIRINVYLVNVEGGKMLFVVLILNVMLINKIMNTSLDVNKVMI